MKKLTQYRLYIFLASVLILALIFVNCAKPITNPAAGDFVVTVEKLSDVPYVLLAANYTISNYKLNTSDGPIYFQVIPGCATKCPAVVVSMPYNGFTWSNDANDIFWSQNLPSGGLTLDINGPAYLAGSGDQIAYYNNSISDTVGFGGIFLPSGVSSILVYNRFYLGRKLSDYVNDFVQVVDYLPNFSFVDTDNLAFLGASLGGFVSMHASRKTLKKPKVLVGITPLLDLSNEFSTMSTTASRITTNPALLQSTQSFFNSYLRRMSGITLTDYSSAAIASENTLTKMLIIHDTWDNMVPIDQWTLLKSQRIFDSFIFQHATGIDHNTFAMGHAQSSEGYTNEKIAPIYMSYILCRLKSAAESKVIYYKSPDFFMALAEVKAAHVRLQNISWFKNFIQDLCTANISLIDYSPVSNFGTISGELMAGGIIVNTWGQPTTIANGCSYLQTHPTIFD